MVKGIFIHDHKFPKQEKNYFYSYGFDAEFFSRYKNIFEQLNVIGREVTYNENYNKRSEKIEDDVIFFTIRKYKDLLNKKKRISMENKIKNSDILIIRLPSFLGLYSIHLANKTDKPYVIELVGCPWDAHWYNDIKKRFSAPFVTFITKRAIRNSKYVIYVTENFLQKRYPTRGSQIACSNVTIKDVCETSLEYRLKKIDKFVLADKKIILGTVGTVNSIYKGQHYVIESMAKLKKQGYSIEYHLIGGGDQSFLRETAKMYSVENEVIFHGIMSHVDIFNWFKSIDLYVQPSDTEGLPRTVIEAMSVACPVIGSSAGGIPELIEHTNIFSKGNSEEICILIKNLTVNKMKKSAEANFETSKKYKKEILYKRRNDFYKEVIKNEIEV
ncbi:glycosyltransferase family 4 protein [Carnobacterium sp. ISL-102]|uniref:glycosyltransferase family 4 protein n=1 Tax=Carnobacterium sp. ISL-102 TaxID=2819142 RepID=UPI001BE93622|nr:glycosyltransferase family 4 protein [Carnobacterium sp. ISL-102]MBT2731071.1 glycosyltransferase family 4 protein [Carnobacterium sp. ISL-102]